MAVGVEEKETRSPEPFTDASLIKAMMNIGRYVDDPAVRRTLPSAVSTPERTALWEQRLRAISEQQDDPDAFQQALLEDLRGLLTYSDAGKLRHSLQTAQGEASETTKRTGKTSKTGKRYVRRKSPGGRKKTTTKE